MARVGTTPKFESVTDACAAGVAGEIENAAMYGQLIGATHRGDIIEVFENLRRASQDNHLPAFRRCTQRGNDEEDHQQGHGRRRRHRGNQL